MQFAFTLFFIFATSLFAAPLAPSAHAVEPATYLCRGNCLIYRDLCGVRLSAPVDYRIELVQGRGVGKEAAWKNAAEDCDLKFKRITLLDTYGYMNHTLIDGDGVVIDKSQVGKQCLGFQAASRIPLAANCVLVHGQILGPMLTPNAPEQSTQAPSKTGVAPPESHSTLETPARQSGAALPR